MRTAAAPCLHGCGPFTNPAETPPGGDAVYMAALPSDKRPAFARYRIVLGKWGGKLGNRLFYANHFDKWLQAEKAAGRATALVSLWPNDDIGDGNMPLLDAAVLAGQWDDQLKLIASAIADFGGPVWVTPRSECNGNWKAGISTPFVYPLMFRRVAAIMHSKQPFGASKVRMVWHTHPQGPFDPWETGWYGANPFAAKLYPGDKYVRGNPENPGAFGISIYGPLVGQTAAYAHALCEQAVKRGMDVIFGETSCAIPGVVAMGTAPGMFATGSPASLPLVPICIKQWMQPWVSFIDAHPVVKAFSYGNHDWSSDTQGFSTWQDGRLAQNPATFQWWEDHVLSLPWVVHAPAA